MIERLGRDIVVDGDILPGADYYDGIDDTEDGAKIDKIISGIDRKEYVNQHDVEALARGVLFLLDKESDEASMRSSVEQHPSAQNASSETVSNLADEIIKDYHKEVATLTHYKKNVDLTLPRRDASIGVIRNLATLSDDDKERVAEALGFDKSHFKAKTQPANESEIQQRDFRERQFKD
jgi:hypothetical protein